MTPKGYQLLDSGNFLKLEQVGNVRLVRPAAAAVWQPRLPSSVWKTADASFERDRSGGGKWVNCKSGLNRSGWPVDVQGLVLMARLTDFGHIGLFVEHHSTDLPATLAAFTTRHARPMKLLNLFAYTGALTLVAAKHGAHVTHVDASKSSVAWARENATASGIGDAPVRWLVDDVRKFVERELRRGSTYDGIVLDPPSYGRGNRGEVWKIERDLPELLGKLSGLMSKEFCFLSLTAHTPGYTPIALTNLVSAAFPSDMSSCARELTIAEKGQNGRLLPSGAGVQLVGLP